MRRSSSSGVCHRVGIRCGRYTQWAHVARAVPRRRSLSPIGKHALLGHEGCISVMRHHARAADDIGVGARCRGALAAMEERRGAVPSAAGAARAADEGHLMIS